MGPTTLTTPAVIGQPPLYVLAGTLLPLLPSGVDTLVASNDPSTVSLSAMAGTDDAAAWVRGPASATYLDGSMVTVTDDAAGVLVTWTPGGTGETLVITLDLSVRTGKTTPLSQVVSVSGPALTAETSVALVEQATVSASYLSGDQAALRLVGPASARFQ
jgi:hypothetical protein